MAPFKSSLAKSAGKLFGVFRQGDLSLRGATQISRKVPPPPNMANKLVNSVGGGTLSV